MFGDVSHLHAKPLKPEDDRVFAPGEDRSPNYPICTCWDRFKGGPPLHPIDGGACSPDENDSTEEYPEF